MNDASVKFRLTIGDVAIEYEGSESFLKDDLSDTVNVLSRLLDERGATSLVDQPSGQAEARAASERSSRIDFSTTTIASRMNASTGPELAIAASARLTLVDQREIFSRADILAAMKDAAGHYKTTMGSNLTATLKSLVRSRRLNETAAGTYALTANEKEVMEKLLAQQH